MDQLPPDFFVTSEQFTKLAYRNVYPAIDPTSPALSQAGKVVIVTGASRGLGARAFAASFAKAGAKGLVLAARDLERLKEVELTIKEINPKVETLVVRLDIGDPASVKDMYDQVAAKFGHADVVVNNAVLVMPPATFKDIEYSSWTKEFEVNVHGTFSVSQGFLRQLPENARGTIVNITTTTSFTMPPSLGSYSLTKLVVFQQTACIAAENPNVTAVALHPGIIRTEATFDIMQRFALDSPELPGGTAVWLTTEDAQFMSGRFMSANWNVVELKEREEEIKAGGLLKLAPKGELGANQFGGDSKIIV